MKHVIPTPAVTSLPVVGGSGESFPVRRVYCVGRNYVEHAIEMGFTGREPPFFFMKPADAVLVVPEGEVGRMPYPSLTKSLHHEVELVAAIGTAGRDIAAADAMRHVWGYAVGLDMTRRDLQGEAKKMGRPWEVGKSFEASAPCGPIVPAATIGHPAKGAVWLDVNGQRRQTGSTKTMIFDCAQIVSYTSHFMILEPGDVITTGTPPGVGMGMKPPVYLKKGDVVALGIDGLGEQRQDIIAFKL